jgi:glyoxylase-like metal-dependent hydrolase (beta-lactamase superfamily II)
MCAKASVAVTVGLSLGLVALAEPSSAQTIAKPQAPAMGTLVVTLGTRGGPLPTKDRAQSSNLLVVNSTLYLIDVGDGATRRIVQAGFDFRKVGKIFITHPHSDHTNGLATLLASEWEYQRRDPIDVYGGGVERLVPPLSVRRRSPQNPDAGQSGLRLLPWFI